MGIEHRRIDDEHLVGLIGSKKAFGAPAPFSFRVAFHAGGLHDYVDVEVWGFGHNSALGRDKECSEAMKCQLEAARQYYR